ncbi:hypothetical protein D3C72_595260 [compost metagenome]
MLDEHEGGHGLEHADLDLLTLAGPSLVEQGQKSRVEGGNTGDLVRDDGSDIARLARQHGLDGRQTAFRLNGVVIGGEVVVGTAAPVAVAVGVDDGRIESGDRRIIQSKPRDRLGPLRMDEDVGRLDQGLERRHARFGLEVEDDASFAAIDVDEHGAHPGGRTIGDVADRIPAWRFDLDDLRPHVRHQLRAVRPHDHRRDVDDPNTGQSSLMHRRPRLRPS